MSEPPKVSLIEVSGQKAMIQRQEGNEPAKVDLSLFDYVTPEIQAQKDKAGILADMALNVGFAILKRILTRMRREDRENEGGTSKVIGAGVVASDAFKVVGAARMAWDLSVEMEKKAAEQDRHSLSQVYGDREALAKRALAEATAIQKGLLSKQQRAVIKDVERMGHAVQTTKTV
jgi:hypothetical protein